MGKLGIPDRYVDAFCGRVPESVLARHYTNFQFRKTKRNLRKVNIKVLN